LAARTKSFEDRRKSSGLTSGHLKTLPGGRGGAGSHSRHARKGERGQLFKYSSMGPTPKKRDVGVPDGQKITIKTTFEAGQIPDGLVRKKSRIRTCTRFGSGEQGTSPIPEIKGGSLSRGGVSHQR